MRFFLLTMLSILAVTTSTMAQDTQEADDPQMAEKLALATEYAKFVPIEQEVATAIDNIVQQVPKDDRVVFRSVLERTIKVPRIKTLSQVALAEIFTAEELRAMTAFYSTPEGQAMREKMPIYQERLKPVLEEMVREAVQSYSNQKQQQ